MEKLCKGRNTCQQVPQKSMCKPQQQFRRLNFSKEIETANFEVPFSLLINEQGQTSTVSKHWQGGCYDLSYQVSL